MMNPLLQLSSPGVSISAGHPSDLSVGAIRSDGVFVVYTGFDETLAAVRGAASFALPLGVPITLVRFDTIPHSQSLDAAAGISPIATEAFGDELKRIGIFVWRRVCRCREVGAAIRRTLTCTSLVFVGRSRGWWFDSSRHVRHALEAAGHFVVTVDRTTTAENAHA
ncbi:MAG: hypothetical protein ABL982_05985 [Vicinamibacterales bacterium]